FAAAPVDVFVVPVNLMCNHPFLLGHLPGVVVVLYCWTTVVVPLPFLHVSFDVTLPNVFATGVVTVEVAPADNADGVHSESDDLVVAFAVAPVPETVVFATSFEHATCGVVADAGVASGTATRLPAATPMASARTRTETLI